MKKRIFCILVLMIIIGPINTFALEAESNFVEVSTQTKYYKTTYYNNALFDMRSNPSYVTEEITKEEYEKGDNSSTFVIGSVETNYKKMTTSILSNGSKYRYKVVLDWKNMPKVRSYDIIGIGHYASVKVSGNLNFSLNYCLTNGGCTTSTSFTSYISSSGSSALFKLPSDNIVALTATLYFDVVKNTSSTIITQKAYGDYSHATTSITKANAQKHTVDTTGISLSNSIYSYYDEIGTATATWSGSW